MKTRSSALVLGLYFILSAVFAVAQGQNCSIGAMIPGPVTGSMPCLEEQEHIWTYNQAKSFVDVCTNTETGVVYAGIASSVSSSGQCLDSVGDVLDCPVVFVNNSTNGTGPGD